MQVITKIGTQKKNKHRFNIFINDKYAFSVSDDILIKYSLHKGMTLEDDTLVELLEADSLQSSYLLAVNYLSYRMRSIKEVHDYLLKKEIDETHAEQVIVRLLEEKLLDDTQFARAFINDQIKQTTKGPILIKRDLLMKGVTETIATKELKGFTFAIELEKALKWSERRLKRTSHDSYRKRLEKLRLALVGRGYTNPVIQEVIQIVKEDVEDGTEWESIIKQGNKLYRRLSRRYSDYDLINRLKAGLYTRGFPGDLIDKYIEQLKDE